MRLKCSSTKEKSTLSEKAPRHHFDPGNLKDLITKISREMIINGAQETPSLVTTMVEKIDGETPIKTMTETITGAILTKKGGIEGVFPNQEEVIKITGEMETTTEAKISNKKIKCKINLY